MLLLLMLQLPLTLFVATDSCDLQTAGYAEFYSELEKAGVEYGVPVTVILRQDKAQYIVQWGHWRRDRCTDDLLISDAETGRILFSKSQMSALESNRFKDFFAALKAIRGTIP